MIRRIETDHADELVHLDVRKLAKIPPGGGWRAHGRGGQRLGGMPVRVGYG
ncbi:MAG: hypothetical protein ABSC73_02600 [Acidimicrobiales bacterium]